MVTVYEALEIIKKAINERVSDAHDGLKKLEAMEKENNEHMISHQLSYIKKSVSELAQLTGGIREHLQLIMPTMIDCYKRIEDHEKWYKNR